MFTILETPLQVCYLALSHDRLELANRSRWGASATVHHSASPYQKVHFKVNKNVGAGFQEVIEAGL